MDNILQSIESNGTSNGTLDISGGTDYPSPWGAGFIDKLKARGWTINVPDNGIMCTAGATLAMEDGDWRDYADIRTNSSGLNHRYPSARLDDMCGITDFSRMFYGAGYQTDFPSIPCGNGTDFTSTWMDAYAMTAMPSLDFRKGTSFIMCWMNCISLVDFPPHMFDGCKSTSFRMAFNNTSLSSKSVDNILISIESNGTSNGSLDIINFPPMLATVKSFAARTRYMSVVPNVSPPGAKGLEAKNKLIARGWTVNTQ
jgi:hypothetical protein